VAAAIQRLPDGGVVEILPTGDVQLTGSDLTEAANEVVEEQEQHHETRLEKWRQMQQYADASSCGREILLAYFGDRFTAPCDTVTTARQLPTMSTEHVLRSLERRGLTNRRTHLAAAAVYGRESEFHAIGPRK
jgi:superfamily II DNA helicase RecQ